MMLLKYGYDPDLMLFMALQGGMLVNMAATDGAADSAGKTSAAAEEGAAAESGWIRVGRWMSKEELSQMESTNTAVESRNLGGSRMAYPASPDTYKDARAGAVYVEYDIPASSAKPQSAGTVMIPGPNSKEGRLASATGRGMPTMPPVRNIKVVKTK